MLMYLLAGFINGSELAEKTMTLKELSCKLLGTNTFITENVSLGKSHNNKKFVMLSSVLPVFLFCTCTVLTNVFIDLHTCSFFYIHSLLIRVKVLMIIYQFYNLSM